MLDLFSNAYFTLREKKAVMVTCLCKIRQIDIIYIKKGQYGENFYFNWRYELSCEIETK